MNLRGPRVCFCSQGDAHHLLLRYVNTYNLQEFSVLPIAQNIESLEFITSHDESWVPLLALRRLPVARPEFDGEFARSPIMLKLTPSQLTLEITRFQSSFGTGPTTTIQPSPAHYRFSFTPTDLPEEYMLYLLGYRSFDSEFIAALPAFADPSFLFAKALNCNHLIIVSDGSEYANIAGASTIIYDPTTGNIHAAAINISYGYGKVSAYRGECAGLFLGKALLYLLREQLSRLPVIHYIDNKGVISNHFHLHERRAHISGDLWDEIAHFDHLCLRYFNSYDVRWLQGHPEARYESPTDYSLEEALHYLVDDLATKARQNRAAPDPFISGWQYHPRDVFIRYQGRPIFDGIAQTVPFIIGARARELYHYPPLDAQSHFTYQLLYGKSSSVWRRCQNLKFSLSQLSTLERREQWGEVLTSTCCRLCTNPTLPRGALACHENLRHLLLDCLSPRIIDARRRFVTDVITLAESHDVENNPVFSSFVRSRIRITQDSSLRLRLSNPLPDGLNSSELTFLFLTGHWPSDLLSRFQHHYLSLDFSGFLRSLFKTFSE
mmetsp:Transcript_12986/g.17385  ORF Transcript_12986/g.17385 Transcript_12986/m.17385 type:complete len:550 (+) Transcript_12986:1063-2712(+)